MLTTMRFIMLLPLLFLLAGCPSKSAENEDAAEKQSSAEKQEDDDQKKMDDFLKKAEDF